MQFGDGHPYGCGPFQMEWPYRFKTWLPSNADNEITRKATEFYDCLEENFLAQFVCGAVIYSLTDIETETEIEIISLTETKRETEMFSKTETKYKRKSGHTKRNTNWNENDFKTKMITYIGKNRHISASIWFCHFRLDQQATKVAGALLERVLHCKPRLTSTCMNYGPGQLCQKKMPSRSGADGRQHYPMLAPLA